MKQVSDKQIVIYTIGHGNRKIEVLINLLQQSSVEIVIDVRSIPYSRYHPQFRQKNLKASLKDAGINYLWLGQELGGRPTDLGLYINGEANYEAMKETKLVGDGIRQVLQLARENIKVTLMCSESDQNECHRKHLIADELAKLGVTVLHVNKSGIIEQHAKVNDCSLFN